MNQIYVHMFRDRRRMYTSVAQFPRTATEFIKEYYHLSPDAKNNVNVWFRTIKANVESLVDYVLTRTFLKKNNPQQEKKRIVYLIVNANVQSENHSNMIIPTLWLLWIYLVKNLIEILKMFLTILELVLHFTLRVIILLNYEHLSDNFNKTQFFSNLRDVAISWLTFNILYP